MSQRNLAQMSFRLRAGAIAVLILLPASVELFTFPRPVTPKSFLTPSRNLASRGSTDLSMCICINCRHVTNCAAYHFVETKHSQPHMIDEPTFEPREGSPTIHVNVRTNRDTNDGEVRKMWLEHKAETEMAETKAREEGGGSADGPLMGQTKYDLTPKTTVEYDVVKCEDYVEDMGCWVRNMPEEIRLANPDFVPT